LILSVVFAQSGSAGKRAPSGLVHYQLENGLQVILHEDHRLPIVAVDLCYDAGAPQEPQGRAGLAHLFEHMMFEGSAHIALREQSSFMAGIGGGEEGQTFLDRTVYYAYAPANHLEELLWLESDRMGYLLPALTAERLRKTQDVVRNERRQTYENRPYAQADERIVQLLFPTPHPYHGNVIGSHEEIQAATLDDVRDFFKKYYAPNNASLVLDGDFSEQEARALLDRYFGSLPRSTYLPSRPTQPNSVTFKASKESLTDRVRLSRLSFAWATGPAYGRDDPELDLLATLLGGGKASELYRNLVRTRRLANDATCSFTRAALASYFKCNIMVKPEVTPSIVEHEFEEVVSKLSIKGPTIRDLDRAKTRAKTTLVRNIEDIVKRAGLINTHYHYTRNPDYAENEMTGYDTATVESVKSAAQRYLTPERRVSVTVIPTGVASAQ
jgi:zinc protease